MRTFTIILIMCALLMPFASALVFTAKGDIDQQKRYAIINVTNVSAVTYFGDGSRLTGINATGGVWNGSLNVECMLTNSFITYIGLYSTTCRTLNYTAFPYLRIETNLTVTSLAGTSKVIACIDTNGQFYRGNSTGCP